MPSSKNHTNHKEHGKTAGEIRRLKRASRQQLPPAIQKQHSLAICQNIIKEKSYKNSNSIACYLANDAEIDPHPIIEHAWFTGKKVYLPILSPLKNSLYFSPYEIDSELTLNRFNIPEPSCHPSKWKTARQLDLLLLPLVAFDTEGNRLGMGGGFYDRTLSYRQHRQYRQKPTLIGLAHEVQKVEQLESRSWDIPLDFIVTEKQRYKT
jgi:5-formyltetrahydrofolate cyclo-ligase